MQNNSLASKILRSSFWQYIASWLDKIIGFASTIILARILTPDDFGIITAITIVTGFFHVLSTVGSERYIIRESTYNTGSLNTAWTVNILMKCFSSICIFLLADPVSTFMQDERLKLPFQLISISPLILGFSNIGMVLHMKNFNYKPQFYISFTSRLFGFILKIILALYLRDYWAFVYSILFENILFAVGSFLAHPYKPRLSLKNWKKQWSFSQWILFKSIFVFFQNRIDNILLSRLFPLEILGRFSVAKDIATLPGGQIITPIMSPIYVALSKVHSSDILFADKIYKSLCVIFLLAFPISFGIFITSENLVQVLLGNKWENASDLVMILSFILIPNMLSTFLNQAFTALGNVKLIFFLDLIAGIITISIFVFLSNNLSLIQFSLLRVGLSFINSLIELIIISSLSSISIFKVLLLTIIPLICSTSMVLFIYDIMPLFQDYSPLYKLIIQTISGTIFYLILSTLFIYLFKKTNEYNFVNKIFFHNILNK